MISTPSAIIWRTKPLDTGLRFLNDVYETFALLVSQQELGWPCKLGHPGLQPPEFFV